MKMETRNGLKLLDIFFEFYSGFIKGKLRRMRSTELPRRLFKIDAIGFLNDLAKV